MTDDETDFQICPADLDWDDTVFIGLRQSIFPITAGHSSAVISGCPKPVGAAKLSGRPVQYLSRTKEGQLLRRGPYQFIRHPMYASALLLIWVSILGHLSPTNVLIGVLFTGVVAIRIVIEEQLLHTRYPDYAAYSLQTKR